MFILSKRCSGTTPEGNGDIRQDLQDEQDERIKQDGPPFLPIPFRGFRVFRGSSLRDPESSQPPTTRKGTGKLKARKNLGSAAGGHKNRDSMSKSGLGSASLRLCVSSFRFRSSPGIPENGNAKAQRRQAGRDAACPYQRDARSRFSASSLSSRPSSRPGRIRMKRC